MYIFNLQHFIFFLLNLFTHQFSCTFEMHNGSHLLQQFWNVSFVYVLSKNRNKIKSLTYSIFIFKGYRQLCCEPECDVIQ